MYIYRHSVYHSKYLIISIINHAYAFCSNRLKAFVFAGFIIPHSAFHNYVIRSLKYNIVCNKLVPKLLIIYLQISAYL